MDHLRHLRSPALLVPPCSTVNAYRRGLWLSKIRSCDSNMPSQLWVDLWGGSCDVSIPPVSTYQLQPSLTVVLSQRFSPSVSACFPYLSTFPFDLHGKSIQQSLLPSSGRTASERCVFCDPLLLLHPTSLRVSHCVYNHTR